MGRGFIILDMVNVLVETIGSQRFFFYIIIYQGRSISNVVNVFEVYEAGLSNLGSKIEIGNGFKIIYKKLIDHDRNIIFLFLLSLLTFILLTLA